MRRLSGWRWLGGAALALCMGLMGPGDAQAAPRAAGVLHIYVIDVEGGQSTLFVAPGGQSLLIDTGWPDHAGRDANRIVAAAKAAGIRRIDYVILTHYHNDHVGGVPQLVARIPVGTFIDHGPNRETTEPKTEHGYELYQQVLATKKYGHITAKPGMVLPLRSMKVEILTADGNMIQKPLPGAGQTNNYCAESEMRPADQTENARSVGSLITFGKVRILDMGDLTWDKEMQLMCPVNRIGHIDLLIVSHHGWYQSSSPALVDGISPVVAIMDNGETKGGSPATLRTLHNVQSLRALYQLHYSKESGPLNTPTEYIANQEGTDPGNFFAVTVHRDGAFTVRNSRTNVAQTYHAQP
jgi:competence protein ComEC